MKTPLANFIHRWVPSSPGDHRVLLALHGTGGDENDLIPLAENLDPKAAILSPRGRVDEHGMNRFFRRFAEGVFDLENMEQESHALAEFLRDAADRYEFSLDNLWAVGLSNGANMAASLLLREPTVLAGALLIRAMVPFEPSPLPDLRGKQIFVATGRHDPMVPLDNAERLVQMFRDSGAEVEHVVLDAGHNLTREDYAAAQSWLMAR